MRDPHEAAPRRLGPYELVRRIATGGMAEVYVARREGPRGFAKTVALKRILPQFASDGDFVAMFVDEARVCARLAHPNIVQVFDFGEEQDELYMAMEFVDGTTTARLLRAAFTRGEEIPLEVTLHICLSVARALDYAHQARDDLGRPLALVHRDVSPGNMLIDRAGGVKLTDFGIARAAEIERRTDAGQLKGKMGYMSPEQVLGRELDARSDLFSLGIVLAELIIRRPLFTGGRELDVLMRIRDADLAAIDRAPGRVPDDVRAILFRALTKEPDQRFATAGQVAEAIEEVLRRRRMQVSPVPLAELIEQWELCEGHAGASPPSSGRGSTEDEEHPTRKAFRKLPEPAGATSHSYRVRADGEADLGPLSYPKVVELFATGRMSASSQIIRDDGHAGSAADYPEFARFVTSAALHWDQQIPRDAADRGRLDRSRFVATLFRLSARRETGAFILCDGRRQKKIYLVNGSPEFVASTEKTELLGEYLAARGQVLPMEVDMALAMLPRFGGRLGDALVGLSVLRPIELFRAIHDQMVDRIIEAFSWQSGEIGFVKGARSQEETYPLGIDPFELLTRGFHAGYGAAELDVLLRPLQEEVIEPVVSPPVRLETFRMAEAEQLVIENVTGKTTLSALQAKASVMRIADPDDVLRAVFLGLSCELIRSPMWVLPPTYKPRPIPKG
jgi:serine/threonine-protein kinase